MTSLSTNNKLFLNGPVAVSCDVRAVIIPFKNGLVPLSLFFDLSLLQFLHWELSFEIRPTPLPLWLPIYPCLIFTLS